MGPTRFELVTSSLSGTRSNQLSYEPAISDGRRPIRRRTLVRAGDCMMTAGSVNSFAAGFPTASTFATITSPAYLLTHYFGVIVHVGRIQQQRRRIGHRC